MHVQSAVSMQSYESICHSLTSLLLLLAQNIILLRYKANKKSTYVFFIFFSPLSYQDQFRDYMFLEAARRDLRVIIENKQRLVLAHATSGYK